MFDNFCTNVENQFAKLSKFPINSNKKFYEYDYINVDKTKLYTIGVTKINELESIINEFIVNTISLSNYFIPNYIKKSIKDNTQKYYIFNSYLMYAKKDDYLYPFLHYNVNKELLSIISFDLNFLKSGKNILEYKVYKIYMYILTFTKKLIHCKKYIEENINKNINTEVKNYVNICDKILTFLKD